MKKIKKISIYKKIIKLIKIQYYGEKKERKYS